MYKKRKEAAGVLLYRRVGTEVEFLLVHPGGPYNKNKDAYVWSIPKGEVEQGEVNKEAAIRELKEETGIDLTSYEKAEMKFLSAVNQSSRKRVYCWCLEFTREICTFTSNTFSLEWPPNSNNIRTYPEVDRVEWMTLLKAKPRIVKGQLILLETLLKTIDTL
jgi:predicted NUDIX family NTP pyrophosphohydrolase